MLKFEGENYFRQRLIMSILSGKSVRITDIRTNNESTGLTEYEASFIRLLEKITNGTTIEINHTGTMITLHPGIISGGHIRHTCPTSRAIGYFLEPIIALAPFCKTSLNIIFEGITNDNIDISVDLIRTAMLPQLSKFGIEDAELKVQLF
jgi:RNA 3'-terminal phosphate cyclase-like protein